MPRPRASLEAQTQQTSEPQESSGPLEEAETGEGGDEGQPHAQEVEKERAEQ